VAGGLEAVVVAPLLDGLVIQHGRGRSVDRLRVGATGQQCGCKCCSDAKGSLNHGSPAPGARGGMRVRLLF
jgi:hypothetical protein